MLQQIFDIIAPVLVVIAIGFIWAKRKMPLDDTMVSLLMVNLGVPCLLISALLSTQVDLADLGQVTASALVLFTLTSVVAYMVLKIKGLRPRDFLPVMVVPNTGNLGMSLCFLAFGGEGLALASAFFAIISVLQHSVCVAIASGQYSVKAVLRMPVLWAVLFAAACIGFDVTLPKWAANTVDVMGGLVIPLMLISLGASLSRLQISSAKRHVGFALFRLGAGFAVAVFTTWLLGLEGAARGAVIIQASMPAAVMNYMYALRFGNKPEAVAGIVVMSTLLSFATLPFLMAFVLST